MIEEFTFTESEELKRDISSLHSDLIARWNGGLSHVTREVMGDELEKNRTEQRRKHLTLPMIAPNVKGCIQWGIGALPVRVPGHTVWCLTTSHSTPSDLS